MRRADPPETWRGLTREPLVHFAAIGLTLFALDGWRGSGRASDGRAAAPTIASTAATAPAPRTPIEVDSRALGEIRARADRRLGRPPTVDELDAETERWIDEEILYREGLERGLDRFDPVIRERVATRMSYVLAQSVIVPEPSELELRAWFESHADRWAVPDRLDFTHVFIAGGGDAARARADDLAAALAAGAAPEHLGDRFSGGHRYRGRRLADLARSFGDEFADGLDAQAPGRWVRRRSRFGLHLVRVDRVEPGREPDFADARLDVRKEWRDAARDRAVRAAIERERAGWEVVRR